MRRAIAGPGIGPRSTRRTVAPPPKLEPMSSRFIFSSARKPLVLAVIASGLFFVGCGSSTDKAVEQTAEQTYEVDATGTFSASQCCRSGSHFLASDGASMKVTTTRKA